MNEEKLRIAIGTALGMSPCRCRKNCEKWLPAGVPQEASWSGAITLPNYTGSRDAAIEAVIALCDTEEKESLFALHLTSVCANDKRGCHQVGFAMLTATPLQICTALAKALNLNVEE